MPLFKTNGEVGYRHNPNPPQFYEDDRMMWDVNPDIADALNNLGEAISALEEVGLDDLCRVMADFFAGYDGREFPPNGEHRELWNLGVETHEKDRERVLRVDREDAA